MRHLSTFEHFYNSINAVSVKDTCVLMNSLQDIVEKLSLPTAWTNFYIRCLGLFFQRSPCPYKCFRRSGQPTHGEQCCLWNPRWLQKRHIRSVLSELAESCMAYQGSLRHNKGRSAHASFSSASCSCECERGKSYSFIFCTPLGDGQW